LIQHVHMESYVIHPLTILMTFYTTPSSLICKRHKKLLDYDGAYAAYEKVNRQSLKQAHTNESSQKTSFIDLFRLYVAII
jgi:hypothetical protein